MRDERTYQIIGAAMEVHKQLGHGFSEHVYQDALEIELFNRNIPYNRERQLKVCYKGVLLKHDFFADFVCYDNVIVECKAVSELDNLNRSQILNYMKVSGFAVGLLVNFGEKSLTYERFVM